MKPEERSLADSSVLLEPVPCPSCGRPSRLTAYDGEGCLACGIRSAAGTSLGEGVYVLATDNLRAA